VDVTASVAGQSSATGTADQFTYPSTCTGAGLTATPGGSVSSGQDVTLSASSTGCPTPQYEFWVQPPGGNWGLVQSYSAATANWATAGLAAGTYGLEVWAEDAASASGSYDAYSPIVSLTLAGPASTVVTLYDDTLAAGWVDYSFGSTVNYANSSPVYAGSKSIAVTVTAAWGGLELHSDSGVAAAPFCCLRFVVQASQGGADFQVQLMDVSNSPLGNPVPLSSYGGNPQVGVWTCYAIPLADLGAVGKTIGGIVIADNRGQPQPLIYVDQILLAGP
jgi:hypothetical protein